ncbi:hypothetical protein [Phaeobacter inhibens]|uniref:hypothetical protein n=1 Tax=Phaeobacter inhibens TaxID=221822 RepID=UPI002491C9F1|nr:hypothetical protein [Phaeobacter inhibens]
MPKKDTKKSLNQKERLTETSLKTKKWEGQSFQVRDSTLPGFFAEVNKQSISLKIQADLWVGEPGRRQKVRTVRRTIGRVGMMSVAEGRMLASEYLSKIKIGIDPFAPNTNLPHQWSYKELIENYLQDCADRDLREATIYGYLQAHRLYLADWDHRPANSIKKSDARSKFRRLTQENGKIAANKAMRLMSAAHNWARSIDDDNEHFAINPIDGVTLHTERGQKRSILPEELPTWKAKVDALQNPLRRELHYLNLFSALRAKTILQTRRDWIDLQNRAVHFPNWAMKSRRDFDMPLSDQMVDHVEAALAFSEMLYPGSEWLFPTWSRKKKQVVHSQVIRERSIPSQTGHILRSTHRTFAQRIKINRINGRLLLDHVVEGIDGVYVDDKALFDPLLEDQQAISNEIERFLNM